MGTQGRQRMEPYARLDRGDDDLTDEIERAQFTSLNIAQPNDLKR